MHLFENLGGGNWGFDVPNFTLTTSEGNVWKAQVIGLETPQSVWMWAWADSGNLNPESTKFAMQLKAFGEEQNLEEFTTAKLSTENLSCGGHTLSVVSASRFDEYPYFAAPQGAVTLFIIIDDPAYPANLKPVTPEHFASLFSQMLADYMIEDHRTAAESALLSSGFEVSTGSDVLVGRSGVGNVVVSFDDASRIATIDVNKRLHDNL